MTIESNDFSPLDLSKITINIMLWSYAKPHTLIAYLEMGHITICSKHIALAVGICV